jgi:hypothetical protein
MRTTFAALVFATACSNASSGQKPDAPVQPPDVDAAPDAAAQPVWLSYTGGTYTNHFDGLPSATSSATAPSQTVTGRGPFAFTVLTGTMEATGMTGWQFANPTGTSTDTEFRAQDGSQTGSAGRGVISFGTDLSTERALGTLATGNQIPVFGLVLHNDTSAALSQLTLAYVGEQWRRGTVTTADSLAFEYGVATALDATGLTADPELDFASPNTQASPTDVAVDGTLPANRHALGKTISGLSWPAGGTLVLRWTASQGSGHDDGLAIDDFSFSAAP